MGKVLKGVAKFAVATAAIGGLCYVFKDQIKESKVYKEHDIDSKIQKVKTTIKEKMPKFFADEEAIVEEGEIFVDDANITADDMERDYVDIDTDIAKAPVEEAVTPAVPTIEI